MSIRTYSRAVATSIGLLAYKFKSTRKLYKASARLIQPVGKLIVKDYRAGEITADLDNRLARSEIKEIRPFAVIGSERSLEQAETGGSENKGEAGENQAVLLIKVQQLLQLQKTNPREFLHNLGELLDAFKELGFELDPELEREMEAAIRAAQIQQLAKTNPHEYLQRLDELSAIFKELGVELDPEAKKENEAANRAAQIQQLAKTNPMEYLYRLGELSAIFEELGVELDPELKRDIEAASKFGKKLQKK